MEGLKSDYSEDKAARDGDGKPMSHILPAKLLVLIWALLLLLTFATVAVSKFDFGGLNLWVALVIATGKAALVALFFMHLRYEKPIIGLIFISTLVFVLLFISITLMDTQAYAPTLIEGYAPKISQ